MAVQHDSSRTSGTLGAGWLLATVGALLVAALLGLAGLFRLGPTLNRVMPHTWFGAPDAGLLVGSFAFLAVVMFVLVVAIGVVVYFMRRD